MLEFMYRKVQIFNRQNEKINISYRYQYEISFDDPYFDFKSFIEKYYNTLALKEYNRMLETNMFNNFYRKKFFTDDDNKWKEHIKYMTSLDKDVFKYVYNKEKVYFKGKISKDAQDLYQDYINIKNASLKYIDDRLKNTFYQNIDQKYPIEEYKRHTEFKNKLTNFMDTCSNYNISYKDQNRCCYCGTYVENLFRDIFDNVCADFVIKVIRLMDNNEDFAGFIHKNIEYFHSNKNVNKKLLKKVDMSKNFIKYIFRDVDYRDVELVERKIRSCYQFMCKNDVYDKYANRMWLKKVLPRKERHLKAKQFYNILLAEIEETELEIDLDEIESEEKLIKSQIEELKNSLFGQV